ncbi:MAG: tRNA (adenosine(37)-N6)-dimethylallyltransferase MiaA [Eubacterium sp.]|nr:tRNA (adenosine(37)-N6)-dimethylallyltransferase MiaA [Eubacterium sp.]MDD7209280.1 tRNA (adenosine(37)-N6)-dimethylallyltransferase MiaA [Lachnospiraceae bacterium]MDY5497352.1 tRNA (adenosine(37)-N6)-dimethylallyltransferase MiaA [Anaerobutyricum sp.]
MEKTEKKPLIVLTGPTAAGKTSLSLRLAKKIGGEIISADSMQVYKKMDIGTAKIRPEQMEDIPHYMVDILDPSEEFNVVIFVDMAKKAMEKIYGNGHIPILVGGTGFYIQALLYDIDFSQHEQSEEYRKELTQLAAKKGENYLHDMLIKVDPEYAANVHFHNVKKVIRALEFYKETGQKLSEHNKQQRKKESPYNFAYFVLYHDREVLYDRIDRRVDQMMEDGLLEEVEGLVREGYTKNLVSMQGLGYKEFFPYFSGKASLEETVEKIKKDTRHFAKRQLTWFRREKEVIWFNKNEYEQEEKLLSCMLNIIGEKGIWNGRER